MSAWWVFFRRVKNRYGTARGLTVRGDFVYLYNTLAAAFQPARRRKRKMTAEPRANLVQRISLALLAAYWVALLVATHVPPVPPPIVLRHGDKWLHFTAFALLAALFAWTWSLRGSFGWRQALAALAILALYGAIDEITQPYFGRYGHVADWYADLLGSVTGLVAFLLAGRLVRQRR
jgi:VanZ family protein